MRFLCTATGPRVCSSTFERCVESKDDRYAACKPAMILISRSFNCGKTLPKKLVIGAMVANRSAKHFASTTTAGLHTTAATSDTCQVYFHTRQRNGRRLPNCDLLTEVGDKLRAHDLPASDQTADFHCPIILSEFDFIKISRLNRAMTMRAGGCHMEMETRERSCA